MYESIGKVADYKNNKLVLKILKQWTVAYILLHIRC